MGKYLLMIVCLLGAFVIPSADLVAYGPLVHVIVAFRSRSQVVDRIQSWHGPLSDWDKQKVTSALMAGALAHDVGYVDASLRELSDLLHYDGTGAFVDEFLTEAIRDNKRPEVIAFAFGALSHYAADREGHYWATNRASARLLGVTGKVGGRLTYEDNEECHTCIEAGFDALVLRDLSTAEITQFLAALDGMEQFIEDKESLRYVIARALSTTLKTVYGLEARVLVAAPSGLMEVELVKAYGELMDRIGAALAEAQTLYGKSSNLRKTTFPPKLVASAIRAKSLGCGKLDKQVQESPEISDWFRDSLSKSSALYQSYLDRLSPQPGLGPSMWPASARPHQINLDTNLLSARGEYFLADAVVDWVDKNGKPTGSFTQSFEKGFKRGDFYLGLVRGQDLPGLPDELTRLEHGEISFDSITAPGRSAPPALPSPLPAYKLAASPECERSGLTAFKFGPEPAINVGPGLVCMNGEPSLLAVWTATLTSAGQANRAELENFYLETRYAYSHDHTDSAKFKQLCASAR